MDQTQQSSQSTTNQPAAPVAPATQAPITPQGTNPPQQTAKAHKGLFFIIIGVVILLAIIGVTTYLFMQNQGNTTSQVSQAEIQSVKPRYKSTPTVAPVEGTVEEIEAVTIDDDTSDTTELQADINQL